MLLEFDPFSKLFGFCLFFNSLFSILAYIILAALNVKFNKKFIIYRYNNMVLTLIIF